MCALCRSCRRVQPPPSLLLPLPMSLLYNPPAARAQRAGVRESHSASVYISTGGAVLRRRPPTALLFINSTFSLTT